MGVACSPLVQPVYKGVVECPSFLSSRLAVGQLKETRVITIDDDKGEAVFLPAIGDDVSGAQSLKDNIARHSETLDRLSASLRKLGMDECQIDEHVVGIFQEYQRELVLNLERLGAKQPGAFLK